MVRPRRHSGSRYARFSQESGETEHQLGSLVNSEAYLAHELARRRRQRRWTCGYLMTIALLMFATAFASSLWLHQKNEIEALRSLVSSIDEQRSLLQRHLEMKEKEKKQCEEKRESECTMNFTESFGIEIPPPPPPPHLPHSSQLPSNPQAAPDEEELSSSASSDAKSMPSASEKDEVPPTAPTTDLHWLFQYRYRWTFHDTYSWKMMILFWPAAFLFVRFYLLGGYHR